MPTKTTKRRPSPQPVQAAKTRATRPAPFYRERWFAGAALVAVAAVIALVVALGRGGGQGFSERSATAGLPQTSDYHSLLVAPSDPGTLLLGTHEGLFRSSDAGRSWAFAGLEGQDAMNLARPSPQTIWMAGHEVMAKSTDGGKTWQDVRPDGLPGLDVHGLAVDPRNPKLLYAAIAGQGLYRSTDGGRTFSLLIGRVGANVMALAVTKDGRILAGDMRLGLLESRDGSTWRQTLAAGLMGIAVNPSEPQRILATGPGVFLSIDGGRTWTQVMRLEQGLGPVAWSPSSPKLAYAVGFDGVLYRSGDGGAIWQPVA